MMLRALQNHIPAFEDNELGACLVLIVAEYFQRYGEDSVVAMQDIVDGLQSELKNQGSSIILDK